jgi:hypothetical protein
VASSCEHGDEPSGSIKCGEFLDQLSVLLASQEGLCSMELVSCVLLMSLLMLSVTDCRGSQQHCTAFLSFYHSTADGMKNYEL